MASSPPDGQKSPAPTGRKRKLEPDEHDKQSDERQNDDATSEDDGLLDQDGTNDENDNDNDPTFTPDDEDDEDEGADDNDDGGYESFSEENANSAIYDESQEPFPACVVYDASIRDIKKWLTSIPRQILGMLPKDDSKSKSLSMHIAQAKNISEFPKTVGVKIAILGSAGAGKSSLLNAVTNIPDLAKSMSGGQSCTSVPMIYCGATERQPKTYAAGIQYLDPDDIRRQISETISHYTTYAFEMDSDWDEDEKMAARAVHMNAETMLRTMFCNLPGFKNKSTIKKTLQNHHSLNQSDPPESLLLDELLQVCQEQLKGTATMDYRKQFSANSPAELKVAIDSYLTQPSKFTRPVFWPLIKEVLIGVRGSRVLNSVTLVDLPGISDTNEARVELSHEQIKSCDYVCVVAPLDRITDDSTVNQLFSRYAKTFKGKICVICTHTDDGVVGDEENLMDLVENNLEDHEHFVTLYSELKEMISGKTTEINQLVRSSKTVKKSRQSSRTTAKQPNEVSLEDLKKQRRVLLSKSFACVVLARNALITQGLIEHLGDHMPEGHELDVHCVSSLHYAALNGREMHGPRLSAEDTGIPRLRAEVLTLAAPLLQGTLEHYMNFSIPSNLKSIQAWLNGTAVDCRSELLDLARQPQEDLEFLVARRLAQFKKECDVRMQNALEEALPGAKEAASRHVARKRNRFGSTIMAFVRKNGKHSTRMCSKECWNEGFLKHFADVVKESQESLAEARQTLDEDFSNEIDQRLKDLTNRVKAHPASFPKGTIFSQIQTCKVGIDNAFVESERSYAKGAR